jgi:L-ascorbate metabolism protein UlaG (beta-lactamase superfamily)
MLELGTKPSSNEDISVGYRIYISGDTLLVDDLKQIPEWLKGQGIDLMLIHLGGTTIPGPSMPFIMVTMDASQGVQLMRLVNPDVTIPIHFDDYDVFLSPLEDFKSKVEDEGLGERVVYLERGDRYLFRVRE